LPIRYPVKFRRQRDNRTATDECLCLAIAAPEVRPPQVSSEGERTLRISLGHVATIGKLCSSGELG